VINYNLQCITLRLCRGGRRETVECYVMLPDDYTEANSSVNKPYKVTVTVDSPGNATEEQIN